MNNYNPYGAYPYSNYQPYQGYGNQPMQQQYQQPVVYPITYTSGVIGAKAFPMQQPNSTIYLLDSDNQGVIYEKKADQQGRCYLKAYTMNEIALDDITNNVVQEKASKAVTKDDIIKLEKTFNEALDSLKKTIEGIRNEQSSTSINAINANGQ